MMEKGVTGSGQKIAALRWVDKLFSMLTMIMRIMVCILLFVMVATVFCNILGRYIFSSSLNWADEVSRAAFVWVTFIAIVSSMWERAHVGMGNVIARIYPAAGKWADAIAAILEIIFSLYLVVGGWQLAELTTVQLTEYFKIPYSYIYGVVPVLAVLMGIVGLRDLIQAVQKREVAN